jgi:hypothetical protein
MDGPTGRYSGAVNPPNHRGGDSRRPARNRKPDRKISAGFNTGQLTGNATLYLKVAPGVWQTFRIIDTNPSAVCKC